MGCLYLLLNERKECMNRVVSYYVAQVLAKSLLIGEHAYLKSGWNIMDGFLVFISLVDIAFVMLSETKSPRIFGILRVFRLLRTLRPLRHVYVPCSP